MIQQNWEYTTITNPKKQKSSQVQQSKGSGSVTSVQKGVTNQKSQLDGRYVATILNDEDEKYTNDTVCHQFKIALQQARNAKGLTQEQLAHMINEKKSVITDYEKGTAIPSQGVIFKLEQRLGTKLPRAVPKKKKKSQN